MKKLLCLLNIHWLINHVFDFVDIVDNKSVYNAQCSICKKYFLVDSLIPFMGFKVEKGNKIP